MYVSQCEACTPACCNNMSEHPCMYQSTHAHVCACTYVHMVSLPQIQLVEYLPSLFDHPGMVCINVHRVSFGFVHP